MRLVIDNREHALIDLCKQNTQNFNTCSIEVATLPIGDILLKTEEDHEVLIIERKTFQDLLSSIKDGRYEEQSYRLLHSSGMPPHHIVYLIEGMMSQIDARQRKLIYSTMTSLNVFKGFSVLRSSSVQETSEIIMTMADKIDRDLMKGRLPAYLIKNPREQEKEDNAETCVLLPQEGLANSTVETSAEIQKHVDSYSSVMKKVKKDNICPENIGEIMLCQIPGISHKSATVIMQKVNGKFCTLIDELRKNPNVLENIVLENGRKMNHKLASQICKFIL